MKKTIVKIGFKNLSIPGKIQKAGQVIKLMKGNAAFPAPNPTIDEVEAAILALDDAHKLALDGG